MFASIHSDIQHLWRCRYWRITSIYCALCSLCVCTKTTSSWNKPIESEIMPFLLDSSPYQTVSVYITYITANARVYLLFSICFFVSLFVRLLYACLILAVYCIGVHFFFTFSSSLADVDPCNTRNMAKTCKRHTRKPDISTFTNSLPALTKSVLFWWLSLVY